MIFTARLENSMLKSSKYSKHLCYNYSMEKLICFGFVQVQLILFTGVISCDNITKYRFRNVDESS